MADVNVVIRGTDEASGPLGNVATALRGLGEAAAAPIRSMASLGESIGGMAKMAGTLALWQVGYGALQGIGTAVKDAGEAILGFNGQLEQAQVAFTTMLGSGQAAKTFLDQLRAFAIATPFEFPDLLTAAQRLTGMGFAAKDVIPIMTDIGNAASAMGVTSSEEIGRITLVLGQMHNSMHLNSQDMNQLIQSGIPAWKILAAQLGVTTGEAMKMAQAGQVSGDVMVEAFRKYSEANWGGMMQAQSQTFLGALSNVKDGLRGLLADGFSPLFDVVRNAGVALGNFLMTDRAKAFGAAIKADVADALTGLEPVGAWVTGTLIPAFERVGPVLATVGAEIGKAVDAIKAIAKGDANSFFLAIGLGLAGLGVQFDDFHAKLDAVTAFLFGTLPQAFQSAVQAVRAAAPAFAPVVGNLTAIFEAMAAAVGAVVPQVQAVAGQFHDASDGGGMLQGALQAIATALVAVTGAVRTVTDDIRGNVGIQALLVGILGAATAAWALSTAASIAHTVATTAGTLATNAMTAAQAALNVVMDANPIGLVIVLIAGLAAGLIFAYQHSETFRTIVQTALTDVRLAAEALWTKAQEVFGGIVDAVQAVNDKFGYVIPVILSILLGPVGLVAGLVIAYKTHQQFRDVVQAALADVGGFFSALGDTVSGVINGIMDKINAAMGALNALRGAAGAIGNIVGGAASAVGAAVNPIGGGSQAPTSWNADGTPVYAGRASGGPVLAGVPYIVGEQRPELFIPQTNGFILPSVPSGGGGGSWGGGDTHIHFERESIVIQGRVMSERDLIETVHTGLLRKLRSMPSLGLVGPGDRWGILNSNGIGGR